MTITTPPVEVFIHFPSGPTGIANLHCVYGHWMALEPDQPPELIYVAACRLSDLFLMREGWQNTEWVKLAHFGKPIMVQILAMADNQYEAHNAAVAHLKSLPRIPRCNLHGFNMARTAQVVVDQNGREFASQAEAARAIGVTQAAISQHMNGATKTVRGFRFKYKRQIL